MSDRGTSPPSAAVGGEAVAGATGPRVVLFDFDGVILRGDAFGAFVRARFRRSRWRIGLGMLLATPLLPTLPFTRRWVIHAFVHAALFGVSGPRYRALAQAFGDELARQPRRFHRDALTRLRRHQAAGDRVLVVTGCEEILVTRIFESLGLPEVTVLASRLRFGRLGMRVAWHNIGRHKLRSLEAAGVVAPWDTAYGDSRHDLPMLAGAHEAVLVNASDAFGRRAERVLGREPQRVYWY